MGKCKSCDAEIVWEKTENEKWIPMDPDGHCHFDTCPDAPKHREKHHKAKSINYSHIGLHKHQRQLGEFGITNPIDAH